MQSRFPVLSLYMGTDRGITQLARGRFTVLIPYFRDGVTQVRVLFPLFVHERCTTQKHTSVVLFFIVGLTPKKTLACCNPLYYQRDTGTWTHSQFCCTKQRQTSYRAESHNPSSNPTWMGVY